jgi:hypothetical protein
MAKQYSGNDYKLLRPVCPALLVCSPSQEQFTFKPPITIMCSIITQNGCQLQREFELAHYGLKLQMDIWDSLDDYRKNLPILASRPSYLKKIKIVKKQVKSLKSRIKTINYDIANGCFLCKEGGIVFL